MLINLSCLKRVAGLMVGAIIIMNPQMGLGSQNITTTHDENLQLIENLHITQLEQSVDILKWLGFRRGPKSEKTRSGEHNPMRPQRYTPPPSNSQSPSPFASDSKARNSKLHSVRNTPKPPLYNSRRDQQFTTGIWEFGVSVSTTHTIGEIGGARDFSGSEFLRYHASNNSYGMGIYTRYLMNDWFSVHAGLKFINLSATSDEPFSYQNHRVYSFNNDIFEFSGQSEFRIPALASSPLDLYGFLGIGMLYNDVTIFNQNNQSLATSDEYNHLQPFIPLGAGISLKITNNWKIGYEFGWRNTIFHFLDGVRQADAYDHYFLNSIKIGYVF
jgi:hypothetical protein